MKWMCFHFLILCLITGVGQAEEVRNEAKPVCEADFESPDEYGLYKRLVRDEFLEIAEGQGVDGSSALKATYRGYKDGSRRISTSIKLPKKMDEATLIFDVKFEKGFQFVKGGKLHGLGPDRHITGGHKMKPDGWSARAMWRPDGLRTYIYCQDKEKKHGQGPDREVDHEFQTDRYYSISLYVKLNDPVEKSNGVMQIYIDGKLIAEDRKIQYRSVEGEHTKITRLLFSTFHGGEDPSWAPKNKDGDYIDVYAYFDNLAVYEGLHIRESVSADE